MWIFLTLWTAACQGLLSMGSSRQEHWLKQVAISSSRGSFQLRVETHISCGSHLQADPLLLSHLGSNDIEYDLLKRFLYRMSLLLQNFLRSICQHFPCHRNLWSLASKSEAQVTIWTCDWHLKLGGREEGMFLTEPLTCRISRHLRVDSARNELI